MTILLEVVFVFFRRTLKNRIIEEVKVKPYLNHPLCVDEQKKKDSIHTIDNAIGKDIGYRNYIIVFRVQAGSNLPNIT